MFMKFLPLLWRRRIADRAAAVSNGGSGGIESWIGDLSNCRTMGLQGGGSGYASVRYHISIEDIPMTDFNLPLSGAVTQTFPWTVNYTINLGESSNTAVEGDALSVASYGKQLGRISDVLIVLLKQC
jgi:hypothetical protein